MGSFIVGVVMEFVLVLVALKGEELEAIFKFNGLGD
jgi:hypothetical protein